MAVCQDVTISGQLGGKSARSLTPINKPASNCSVLQRFATFFRIIPHLAAFSRIILYQMQRSAALFLTWSFKKSSICIISYFSRAKTASFCIKAGTLWRKPAENAMAKSKTFSILGIFASFCIKGLFHQHPIASSGANSFLLLPSPFQIPHQTVSF